MSFWNTAQLENTPKIDCAIAQNEGAQSIFFLSKYELRKRIHGTLGRAKNAQPHGIQFTNTDSAWRCTQEAVE